MAAGIEIIIDPSQVEAHLLRKLQQYPGATQGFLRRLAVFVSSEAKKFAHVDRGEMRSKIKVVERKQGEISVIAEAKHSAAVERGSRPHTPPFSPIERWAQRKGLPAGAVWHTIRIRGTKAHPFMAPAAESARPLLPRFAAEELRRWAEG